MTIINISLKKKEGDIAEDGTVVPSNNSEY